MAQAEIELLLDEHERTVEIVDGVLEAIPAGSVLGLRPFRAARHGTKRPARIDVVKRCGLIVRQLSAVSRVALFHLVERESLQQMSLQRSQVLSQLARYLAQRRVDAFLTQVFRDERFGGFG